MDAVAFLASRTGDHQTAARLSGAVADLERRTGTGLGAPNRDISGWEPEVLRDDPATAAAYAEGTQLSPEDAVAAARAWLADYARTAVGR
jgi:hypothetical protein